MFNQQAFNTLPFNRTFSVDINGSFVLSASGEIHVVANITAYPSFELEGLGELVLDAIRQRFGAIVLDSIGELEASGVRDRIGAFNLEAIGELTVSAGRRHVDIIEFVGEFRPGDRIIIDSDRLTFTLNGQNALHLMRGDFFDLNVGRNELIYTDDQSNRTVLMRITYRDKFV